MAETAQMLALLLGIVASRADADYTLREVYGEHASWKLNLSSQQLCHANARLISWLRLLFLGFHQATWSTVFREACMPSADALLDALKFVLAIEESPCAPGERKYDWRSLKQCVLLLGLRLLRGPLDQTTYNASEPQLRILVNHISKAFPLNHGPNASGDVSWLCREILIRATGNAGNPAEGAAAAPANRSHIPASAFPLAWYIES